jgi:hypothetical protein
MDIVFIKIQNDQLELSSLGKFLTMSAEYSGYSRTARKALTDVRRRDYLRKGCDSEAEFKNMWRMECRKKEEKLRAIKEGVWKTRFNHEPNTPVSIRKGRFLITIYNDAPIKPIVVRRGRFLVTKSLVSNKKEPKKPTVTKKGRFVITTSY